VNDGQQWSGVRKMAEVVDDGKQRWRRRQSRAEAKVGVRGSGESGEGFSGDAHARG
jgi:hypothetical protein